MGKTQEQGKEQIQQQEVLDKGKESETISIVSPKSGKQYDLTAQQLYELGAVAISHLEDKQTSPPDKEEKSVKVEKEELTPEERIATLENELNNLKERDKQKEEATRFQIQLNEHVSKMEELKGIPELQDVIKLVANAINVTNPNFDTTSVVKKLSVKILDGIKKYKDIESKAINANARVKNSMNRTLEGGGAAIIGEDKKFTPGDVRKGSSRRAMEDFLVSLSEE